MLFILSFERSRLECIFTFSLFVKMWIVIILYIRDLVAYYWGDGLRKKQPLAAAFIKVDKTSYISSKKMAKRDKNLN